MTTPHGWPTHLGPDSGARFGAVLSAAPRADTLLLAGDPSLQLFGLGWTPTPSSVNDYSGRHRAPDPIG